ncbi:MAG: hypothetical protein WB992_17820 [Bryobacteraceae bacterium]
MDNGKRVPERNNQLGIDYNRSGDRLHGDASATTTGIADRVIAGTTERIEFQVPASLLTGSYFVSVTGSTTGGATFTSSNCSTIQVTHTSTVAESCNPGSSLGIVCPAAVTGKTVPVTAYVPNGSWGGYEGQTYA